MTAWLFALLLSFSSLPGIADPAPEQVQRSLIVFPLNPRLANYKVSIPSCTTFTERLVGVRLELLEGNAYAERLIVTYADRQMQVMKIGRQFTRGNMSPWMDLGVSGFHDSRCVAELYLTAKSLSAPGRRPFFARIRVTGQLQKTLSTMH